MIRERPDSTKFVPGSVLRWRMDIPEKRNTWWSFLTAWDRAAVDAQLDALESDPNWWDVLLAPPRR